jgi:hypothetical protein
MIGKRYESNQAAVMFVSLGAFFVLGLVITGLAVALFDSIPNESLQYAAVWLGVAISLVSFPMLFVTAFWWWKLRKSGQ